MAWLASRQVEYVPEQQIRVPSATEPPEITRPRLASCRICSCWPATGIAIPSHARGDTIGAQRRECHIAVLGSHSEWGGDEQRYWPVFGQPHRGADAGKQVLRPHAGIPLRGAGEQLTGWPAI